MPHPLTKDHALQQVRTKERTMPALLSEVGMGSRREDLELHTAREGGTWATPAGGDGSVWTPRVSGMGS